MARRRKQLPYCEWVPGQQDLISLARARRVQDGLPAVPCPACGERHTDEVDRDLWECPECGHEWRAEMEARR